MPNKISMPFLRTPYNYDTMQASDDSALTCLDESLTIQSEKDEADINTIVRRFGLTGELPTNVRVPQYGDFTGISDYQSALNAVMQADNMFMELPAEIRARFQNDPAQFVEFCVDPKNHAEAVKLGLAVETKQSAEAALPKAGSADSGSTENPTARPSA